MPRPDEPEPGNAGGGVPGGAIGIHLLRRWSRAPSGRGARRRARRRGRRPGRSEPARRRWTCSSATSTRWIRWTSRFEGAGGEVRRHPEDKDATDLELAITDAIVAGAGVSSSSAAIVAGSTTCSRTPLLASLATPRSRSTRSSAPRACTPRGRRSRGKPGELISLFALGGPAHGVRAAGCAGRSTAPFWSPARALGVSNRLVTSAPSIEVRDGVVLAVRPGVEDDA